MDQDISTPPFRQGTSESVVVPPRPRDRAAPSTKGWLKTFVSLQNREYRLLWFGMLSSYMGMQMNIVAQGYLAYDLTKSALALGIVAMARGVPMLVFSLWGGIIADRFEKRRTLFFTQGSLGLIAVLEAYLLFTGQMTIWWLAFASFGSGTVFAFNMPARQAYLPSLVSRHDLGNALALSIAAMNLCRIIGPSVAGVLIGVVWVGLPGVFLLVALGYSLIVVTLAWLPTSPPEASVSGRLREQGIRGGLRYIWGSPILLTLLGMAFIATLFGMPYQLILPVFAAAVVHVDASGLGLMYTATGVGALAGSILVAYLADSRRKGLWQLAFGVGFGAMLLFFALSSSFWFSLFFLVMVGWTSNSYMALNNTMVMLETEDRFYGRVMSVYMITWSLMPLATLPLTGLVELVGSQYTIAGAGLIIVAAIMGIALRFPQQRRASAG